MSSLKKIFILIITTFLSAGCDPYVVCARGTQCSMMTESECKPVRTGGEASEAIRHPDGANMGEWGFTSDTQLRKSALATCKKKGYKTCSGFSCERRLVRALPISK